MGGVNRDAFLALADLIESKPPGAYDQNVWAIRTTKAECGTAACIAGWAATLTPGFSGFRFIEGGADPDSTGLCIVHGEVMPVNVVAAEFLELTNEDRADLFDGDWTPAEHIEGDTLTERVAEALRQIAWGATIDEVTA